MTCLSILIDFKKSYLIGDSETDIISANSVDIKSILYTPEDSIKINQAKPSYIVSSLKQIKRII